MKFRAALAFMAVGAVLRFAITAETGWIKIQTIGLILIFVGIVGLLFTLYRSGVAYSRRRRERLAAALADISVDPESYKPEQPDPTLLTELESAHDLAQKALPFLEAQGFTEGRVHELALAFAAKDIGLTTEEFIDWALAQGRLGHDPRSPSVDA
jgi:membrane-bound ClpP family serine protease